MLRSALTLAVIAFLSLVSLNGPALCAWRARDVAVPVVASDDALDLDVTKGPAAVLLPRSLAPNAPPDKEYLGVLTYGPVTIRFADETISVQVGVDENGDPVYEQVTSRMCILECTAVQSITEHTLLDLIWSAYDGFVYSKTDWIPPSDLVGSGIPPEHVTILKLTEAQTPSALNFRIYEQYDSDDNAAPTLVFDPPLPTELDVTVREGFPSVHHVTVQDASPYVSYEFYIRSKGYDLVWRLLLPGETSFDLVIDRIGNGPFTITVPRSTTEQVPPLVVELSPGENTLTFTLFDWDSNPWNPPEWGTPITAYRHNIYVTGGPGIAFCTSDWVPSSVDSVRVGGVVSAPAGIAEVTINGDEVHGLHFLTPYLATFDVMVPIYHQAMGILGTVVDLDGNRATAQTIVMVDDRTDRRPTVQCTASNEAMNGVLAENVDMKVGSHSLTFRRNYSSLDRYVGPLGQGWTHWFNIQLVRATDGLDSYVLVRLPCGKRLHFKRGPDGTWTSTTPSDIALSFTTPEDRAILHFKDGQTLNFNEDGFVETENDSNGNATRYWYDDPGKLLAVVDASQNRIDFAYYATGQIANIRDQSGRTIQYGYDWQHWAEAHLTRVRDALYKTTYDYDRLDPIRFGRLAAVLDDQDRPLVQYTYDGDQVDSVTRGDLTISMNFDLATRQISETDSLDRSTVTSVNEDGQPVWTIDATGALRQWEYQPQLKAVTRYVDPLGNETRFSYNEIGDMTDVVNADGTSKRTSWAVIAGKHVPVDQVDEAGNVTSYSYDALGNTTCVVDPIGNRVEMTYGSQGERLTEKGSRGYVMRYEYAPGSGNLVRTIDPLGNSIAFDFDLQGNVVAVTDERDFTTDFEYDSLRRCTKVISPPAPDGQRAVTLYEYNQAGQVTKAVDPLVGVTKSSYDQFGRLIETEDALGNKTSRSYDAAGRLLAETDARGTTWSYGFDALDRLVEVRGPQGVVSSSVYDAAGKLLQATDGDGNATTYAYDGMSRLLTLLDARGGTTTHSYDLLGRDLQTVEPSGEVIQREFDALGRALVSRRVAGGATLEVRQEYDGVGNVVTRVDEAGRVVHTTWDPCSRLASIVDAMDGTRRWEYDPTGKLVKFVDQNGGEWTTTRDSIGRVLTERDPLGQETSYRHDLAGRVVEKTEPSGQATHYSYDALGHCTRVDYADGEWAETAYNAAGDVLSVTGSDGTVLTQTIDAAGRIASVTNGALQRRLSYVYTPGGLRSSLTVANLLDATERTTGYTWGADGLLAGVTPWAGPPIALSYDVSGRRIGAELGNGITASYGHDGFGRLSTIEYRDDSGQLVSFIGYTRDALGNPTTMTDTEGQTTYSFDLRNRLAEVHYPDGTWERFTHDAVGNRLTSASPAGLTQYSFDAVNRLQSEAGVRNVLYSWDADGNLLTKAEGDETTQYVWSARNKLSRVVLPNGGTREFSYYPKSDLRRRAHDSNGGDVSLLWDGQNALEELDGQGVSTNSFVNGTGLDERFAYIAGGNSFAIVADAVGSVRTLLDPAGVPVNQYSYRAFGAPRASQEAFSFSYRFGGQPWDEQMGLGYFRARYLDPEAGRFTTADPFREKDRYAYAGGNPIGSVDPTGLKIAPPEGWSDVTLLRDATDILIENATETYPKVDSANYGIRLMVSKYAMRPIAEDIIPVGATGATQFGNLQVDGRGLVPGSAYETVLRMDYFTHIRDGHYFGPCPPAEPLNVISFNGTLQALARTAESVSSSSSIAYAKYIQPAAYNALVLYHEALHALNFNWVNPQLSESVKDEYHERIRASQRNFYWSLYDADLRHYNRERFRLFSQDWEYMRFGDQPYGPRGSQ